jgi:hypothetical protein
VAGDGSAIGPAAEVSADVILAVTRAELAAPPA